MSERMRCLTAGCNPVITEDTAQAHKEATGHRVAKWPVRSADGIKKAKDRNRNGYYSKYNTGDKSPKERGLPGWDYNNSINPFSEEAFEG